jgi:hypothetical protein
MLAIAFSAPALSTVIMGQSSALILLCVVAAVVLWERGRVGTACALLALLVIKPNWGIFFGAYAIAAGHWRGAAVMAAVASAMCLTSLPLGWDVWRGFLGLSGANDQVLLAYEPFKVITLKGFLDAVIGRGALATGIWLSASAGLTLVAARAWRRPGSPLTQLGSVVLLTVAANPHASFYDALVLALPAMAWWAERDRWRPAPWRLVGWLIAIAWCWEQYFYTWGNVIRMAGISAFPPFSVVGPVAAIWLVLAAREIAQDAPESGRTA